MDVDKFIANNEKRVESEKVTTQEILALSSDLANALNNLTDTIFNNRIQRLDEELAANEEKYARLLENENITAERRKEIEERQEADRQRIEAEKRKEQRKQAVYAKALAALNVGLLTAQNILAALAPPPVGLGPIAGIPLSITMGAIGAVQLALLFSFFCHGS